MFRKKVFKNETGRVFIYPSSGTGAWEAAMTNTLSPGDKVLIARFGQFSLLWADMCTRMGLEVDVVDVPWGEGVPVEIFAEKLKADMEKIKALYDVLVVTPAVVKAKTEWVGEVQVEDQKKPGETKRWTYTYDFFGPGKETRQ